MSERASHDPRIPPRAGRHRSSVAGPPPGIEAGTGYIFPQTSPTTTYHSARLPPRSRAPTSSSLPVATEPGAGSTFRRNARPDPEIFDPIMEEPPTPPARSLRRPTMRDTGSSDAHRVMFYPSTTTVSSMDSDSQVEPMPFFRTHIQMPTAGSGSFPSAPEDQTASQARTVSGIALGFGRVDIDPDTEHESEGESMNSSSSFEEMVRSISLVRRGQARIIRNPTSRMSVVPDV